MSRVQEFRRTVAARGGPPEEALDLTPESLGPLGAWLLQPIPPGPEDESRPVWAWNRAEDDPYLKGSWLPDGLGTYVMRILRGRHPSLTWKLETDRRSMYEGHPVLVGMGPIEVLPYAAMLGSLKFARKASPPNPDWLLERFESWSARTAETAAPNALNPTIDVAGDLEDISVEAIDGDEDWNAELWISEAAEAELGRQAYDALYDRFAAIPGIERLEWEDRERFLLRLRPGTDLADVTEAARRAIREAARAKRPRA
jgi:hypothetical protein